MKALTRKILYLGLAVSAVVSGTIHTHLFAASEFDAQLVFEELQRAIANPDNSTTLDVAQPMELVFDALLSQLPAYSEDISEVSFDHSNAQVPGELGVGSLRITTMDNGRELVQKIIVFEPPQEFAYFTDMSLSTVNAPIDYSIGYYNFSEQNNGRVSAKVSVTYKPSSRLTAFIVRLGFNRALSKDFQRAEEYLNELPTAD